MFRFLKPKSKPLPPPVAFLTAKVNTLEKQLHRRIPIDEHAIDHLCDFISTVGSIHPMGPNSQPAKDLRIIAQSVRAQAGRGYDPLEANRISEVFARYNDYRGKEVTYEHLFELAEWILDGASRMGDGVWHNTTV